MKGVRMAPDNSIEELLHGWEENAEHARYTGPARQPDPDKGEQDPQSGGVTTRPKPGGVTSHLILGPPPAP